MVAPIALPMEKDVTNRSTEVTKGKEIVDAQVQPKGHKKNVSL